MIERRWVIAAVTLATLMVASYAHEILASFSAYRDLHRSQPFYVAESLDKIGGALVCFLAVWLTRRTGFRGICRELGLNDRFPPAVAFGLGVSLPMLIGFAITRRVTPHIDLLPLAFLSAFSPIVEEIEFRGFGVRQLQRGTGWPFWAVVWPSVVLFGYGHVEQGQSWQEKASLFFVTAAGGAAFAWLVYRWRTLWVAVAIHIFMNLWWEIFSVSKNAVGGWLPFVLQAATIVFAIVGTLYFTRTQAGLSESDHAVGCQ